MKGKRSFYIDIILEIILICNFCFSNSDTLNTVIDSLYKKENIKAFYPKDTTTTFNIRSNLEDKRVEEKSKKRIVKHTFDYRQQIVLSVTMMVLFALIITSTEAWNPK